MNKGIEEAARGLSRKIGDTDFSVQNGAHYPWDRLLKYQGEIILGMDWEWKKFARAAIKTIIRAYLSAQPPQATVAELLKEME